MRQHEASRTLVKSPPELWAECSDAAALARHLGAFGEIRITRLDPETAVAWEGENVRGTVRIEPAGWGTKVILTAQEPELSPPVPDPALAETPLPETPLPEPPVPDPALDETPVPEAEPVRRRRFARLRAFFRGPEPVASAPEPVPEVAEPALAVEPPSIEPSEPVVAGATDAALAAALDSLGQAHHRPFSRA
jgi:hypothetical protein